jgi:hypothetical protein
MWGNAVRALTQLTSACILTVTRARRDLRTGNFPSLPLQLCDLTFLSSFHIY